MIVLLFPVFVQWAGRRSNPRLRLFRPPLNRLSYQPKQKGQASRWDTWPRKSPKGTLGVTNAEDERGGHSPIDRADAWPICVSQKTRDPLSSLSLGLIAAIHHEDRPSFHWIDAATTGWFTKNP